MTPIADRLVKGLDCFIQTSLSIVKIAVFSKRTKASVNSFYNPNELVILANGPSLNTTIDKSSDFIADKTLLVVNYNVLSPLFTALKPELYVIADPFLWTDEIQMNKLFGELNRKTSWDIHLFIPVQAYKVKSWQNLIKSNHFIHVIKYNATPIEGGRQFCNFVFRLGLGVPRPHNVLIPALMVALKLPFKLIYIAGADHSWLKEISVNENNELLMNQKHFYDKNQTKAETVKRRDFTVAHLHDTLYHMFVAFKSYFIINDYAEYLGKKIYNITPDSFIDAFERKHI